MYRLHLINKASLSVNKIVETNKFLQTNQDLKEVNEWDNVLRKNRKSV